MKILAFFLLWFGMTAAYFLVWDRACTSFSDAAFFLTIWLNPAILSIALFRGLSIQLVRKIFRAEFGRIIVR